ncbi:undecaprenol kinase [Anoxybacillus vitaminiphilus]|jgi:diacylglycerol kinase|uniref:Undecaprenol kinase n=1 Tax=Paranoxybacillus vitaminiphilus TaxID=581036 RepID=A0A327YPL4_9BACL|nr:diacylglycerol kinase family protein [Anoxybacillus vitaminiphilus]RAK22431.1 undecaprenol kinase [Anoxybacillus vitaminiphilus]
MKEWKRLLKSFSFAWEGIVFTFKNEKNMKIHCAVALFVCMTAWLFGLSKTEWFIILIAIGVVLSLEMMNTAIERVVDFVAPEFHPLAKIAKDVAAGAVFVFAIISAIIGAIIFFPHFMALIS